jgi:hypothetical protein
MAKIACLNSQGGSWTTAADWSGGVVPGAGDDVIINAPSSGLIPYELEASSLDLNLHSLTLAQSGAELSLLSTTLKADVLLAAGTLSVGNSSTLSGTLDQTGGTLAAQFGTLSGETIEGAVQLDGFETTITGGLTLAPLHHIAATLTMTGGPINVSGTQTWDGGTLLLSYVDFEGGINLVDSGGAATTLTLGRHLDLVYGQSDMIGAGATAPGAILNNGTMTGSSGGSLALAEDYILNAGEIIVGVGDLVSIDASGFLNRGTLTVSSGGTLSIDAGHWSNKGAVDITGGTLALTGADVAVGEFAYATYTLGGSASLQGTIDNAHRTLTLGTGSGLPFISLGNGGVISGGTVVTGGGLGYGGGTLSGVTLVGPLDMSAANATLEVTGGLAVRPVSGSGNGTILLTGSESSLIMAGTQTLRGLAMQAGAGTSVPGVSSGGSATLNLVDGSITALAASSSLTQVGANLLINAIYGPFGTYGSPAPVLINDGVITAASPGGTLICTGVVWHNAGLMTIHNEYFNFMDYVDPSSAVFSNSGTLDIGAGALAEFHEALVNSGLVDVASGGTLALDVNLASASLAGIDVAGGGVLSIGSTLNNAGTVLYVGSGQALSELSVAGTILGGSIIDSGSGLGGSSGVLDDVAYAGILTIGGQNQASLTLQDGTTLAGQGGSGAGTVVLTGVNSALNIDSAENLGNISITLGAVQSFIDDLNAASLTLGAGAVITQTGQSAAIGYYDSSDVLTAARINAAVAGGTLTLGGTFVNTGAIVVSNGETLALDGVQVTGAGTISVINGALQIDSAKLADLMTLKLADTAGYVTGNLDLQGGTFAPAAAGLTLLGIGAAQDYSDSYYSIAATVSDGIISDPSGLVQFGGLTDFYAVQFEGTLSLSRPLASLALDDGSTVTDATGKLPGVIDVTGGGVVLSAPSLDRSTINIGNASMTYDGRAIAAPTLEMQALGAGITINQVGAYGSIFAMQDLQSTLTSSATWDLGFSGGSFDVWGASVISGGAIAVSSGDTLTLGSAAFVNDGQMSIAGSASAVELDTYNFYNASAFGQTSFYNAGTVSMAGGTLGEITAGGSFAEVPMLNAAGASIAGFGTVAVAVTNDGLVQASGGTLALTQAADGSGTLQVDSGASLQLASVGSGETAAFSGAGGALGLAPMAFLGTIAGFASGDSIDLAGTVASSARFSGDSILVTLTAGGSLTLDTSTALTGALSVTAGAHGDSLITYAGSSEHHQQVAVFAPAHQG